MDCSCGTALYGAAKEGLLDILRHLLDHGADPRVVDSSGRTPENVAREEGPKRTVRLAHQQDS
jgi:ankyrin repeat protein